MAAYTIDYKPQFIQTDVGAVQDKLNALDKQYAASMAGQIEAEDKFSAIPVASSDIELKNEILGGFQNRVKDIVGRYGGDYAAAAKDLAREISSTGRSEFFPLAAEKYKLSEEQRKLATQKGPEHIILQDVNKISLKDPVTGQYIGHDKLGYNVTSATEVGQILQRHFGDLANNVREGDYQPVKGMPWLMSATTYKGITQDEIPQVATDMFKYLKQNVPNLDDNVAQSIAFQEAKNLSKGFEHKEIENFEYKRRAQMQDQLALMNERDARDRKIKADAEKAELQKLFGAGVSTQTGALDEQSAKKAVELNNTINTIKNNPDIDIFKSPTLPKSSGNSVNDIANNVLDKMEYWLDFAKLPERIAQYSGDKRKQDAANFIKTNYGRTVKDLAAKGLSRDQILKTLENTVKPKFKATVLSDIKDMDRLQKNLSEWSGDYYVISNNKRTKKTKANLAEDVLGQGGESGEKAIITNYGYDLDEGTINIRTVQNNTPSTIHVPIDKMYSDQIRDKYNIYKGMKNAYQGKGGEGLFVGNKDGMMHKTQYKAIPNGSYYTITQFNPETLNYDSGVFLKGGDKNGGDVQVSMDVLSGIIKNVLDSNIGK